MSGSARRPRAGQVQLDSRPILPTTDGNENVTEVDAFDKSRQSLDPAAEYKMNHQRRGVALIFNHEYFLWSLRMPLRRGTMADRHNLERSLTHLGFEVRSFDNLKADEMQQKIHEASMEDHSNADCFVCVFLSHGEDDHIYAHDGKIKISSITDMFRGNKCQSLVGKPKIFIIQNANLERPQEVSGPGSCSKQSHGVKPGHAGHPIFIQIAVSELIYEPGLQQIACRGDKHDDAVIAHDSTDSKEPLVNETQVDAASIYTLPAGADFIMCYSVAQGYYSYRDVSNGSWYIQDLCETLRKHGSSLEFTELLTLVNRKVSHRRVDSCQNLDAIGKKQIPCFASMLTKKLYFHPKSK